MYNNYDYPAGADTPDAPWNEEIVPDKEFDVTISQTLSKTVSICTNNYIPGASGCDYEPDDEGGYCAVGWHDPDDTSDTNWKDEFEASDHYTPLQLIQLFKEELEKKCLTVNEGRERRELEHLIDECSEWIDDDTEVIED